MFKKRIVHVSIMILIISFVSVNTEVAQAQKIHGYRFPDIHRWGFTYIAPGTFIMGSPVEELGRNSYEVQHQVTLTRGFIVGRHEVTQGEYEDVMGTNPGYFKLCGDECPVEQVSWVDAAEYCNALSDMEGFERAYTINGQVITWNVNSDGYRLLTEAEWEYVCRAGSTTAFYVGTISNIYQDPNCDLIAWYSNNSSSTTHKSESKTPNTWGIYDMSGNVVEWCWDWYEEYSADPVTDPTGPSSGTSKVIRGGNWTSFAKFCRSADRHSLNPTARSNNVGFRIARTVMNGNQGNVRWR